MRLPNKYQSTDLKKNYVLNLEIGLIISLLTFIGITKSNFSSPTKYTQTPSFEESVLTLSFFDPIATIEKKPPPPPVPKVPLQMPEEKIIEEKIIDLDIEFSLDQMLAIPANKPTRPSNYHLTSSRQSTPQLIGGMGLLQKRIKYPPKAIKDKIEGQIIIQFTIDKTGKVHDLAILKGLRSDVNREALKAISKSRFIPAYYEGDPITVEHVMYIRFQIIYRAS